MTALTFALLALAAAPCTRVAVTPFEPVATTPATAREVEEQVRAELSRRPGLCVEARSATVEKLASFENHRLPPCGDAACVAAQAAALGCDELVGGLVVGAGGQRNVDLARSSATRTARVTAPAAASELNAALSVLFQWDVPAPAPRRLWPGFVALGAGLASAGAGLALGLEARRTQLALSSGATGCGGSGAAYRDCFDAQLRSGRGQATGANVLFGFAGALALGAVVLWVVPLP